MESESKLTDKDILYLGELVRQKVSHNAVVAYERILRNARREGIMDDPAKILHNKENINPPKVGLASLSYATSMLMSHGVLSTNALPHEQAPFLKLAEEDRDAVIFSIAAVENKSVEHDELNYLLATWE